MTTYYLLLILELVGLLIAVYLFWERKRKKSPVCIIGQDCDRVLGSEYSTLFGIHNDVMGMLFYLGMLTLVILLRFELGPVDLLLTALKVMAGGGAVMAIVLMFIQWKVLKKWCFWCIISNVNTWIIAYIVFNAI